MKKRTKYQGPTRREVTPAERAEYRKLSGDLAQVRHENEAVLRLVDGIRDREEIARLTGYSQFKVALILRRLEDTGQLAKQNPAKDADFFPITRKMAQKLVEVANIRPGELVLSVGKENLADEIRAVEPKAQVWLVRMSDLLEYEPGSVPGEIQFEKIVMNQADIDQVYHAFTLLVPGGKLVAIMSSEVESREDTKTKKFRELLKKLGGTVKRNRSRSFFGSTVTIMLEKPASKGAILFPRMQRLGNPVQNSNTLAGMAKQFLQQTPRLNPPEDGDDEAMFNQFIISLRASGKNVSDWNEGQWFKAAREFGFDEEDIGSLMEQVAAWGVDDN